MGPKSIRSKRLILKIEDTSAASRVLDLYLRNRAVFEQFEPTRPRNFYTLSYHEEALRRELSAYNLGQFLRYYIYESMFPDITIGSVNFNFFSTGLVRYAEVGYKIDHLHQNRGYAYEAVRLGMEVLQKHYGIYRFDARIHPHNYASLRLAEKLGFTMYRYEPKSANILGKTEDLIRYSLTTSTTQ